MIFMSLLLLGLDPQEKSRGNFCLYEAPVLTLPAPHLLTSRDTALSKNLRSALKLSSTSSSCFKKDKVRQEILQVPQNLGTSGGT